MNENTCILIRYWGILLNYNRFYTGIIYIYWLPNDPVNGHLIVYEVNFHSVGNLPLSRM